MERTIRKPVLAEMPEDLGRAARAIAARLVEADHEAWLVGGAVRDLALGIPPHDADLATDAHPDAIEALFGHTVGVGRAFGTVLVLDAGPEVQVTTFRSERGYSDARRPDEVRYGASLEEDAARRDFTCNALFLDPATDELRDPTGGFDDLAAGRLRCVGEPAERFREDGLRLLRLARFAASYGLEVEPETLGGARAEARSLEGVSAERIRAELVRMAEGPDPARATGILAEIGVLERVFPGMQLDLAAVGRLPRAEAGAGARYFAALLGAAGSPEAAERAAGALLELRGPAAEHRRVRDVGLVAGELRAVVRGLERGEGLPRSRVVCLLRQEAFEDAARVLEAREPGWRERLAVLPALGPEELRPESLLVAKDLVAAGIPRGPRFGELLREAERLQLDGDLADRAAALRWLRDVAER